MTPVIPNSRSAKQRLNKTALDGGKFLKNLFLARTANSVMFNNTTNVCMMRGATYIIYFTSALYVPISEDARDSRNTNFAGVVKRRINLNSKN